MWNKFRSIKMILFLTYSLIIIIVFTILVIWFYMWASDQLRNNATVTVNDLVQSLQDQVDSEIQQMNNVSLNVMYSNLVKNRFKQYLSKFEENAEDTELSNQIPPNSLESAKELAEILTAAIGPSRPVEQLYLYDFKSKVYGNGFDNGERSYNPELTPWFKPVMENTEGKYINLPVEDPEMSKFVSSKEMQYSISLFRIFYNNYNVPQGIVEVKQYYNHIFKSIDAYSNNNPNQAKVLIYNNSNQIIYPLNAAVEDYANYIELLGNQHPEAGVYPSFINLFTNEKELLSFNYSEFTGWNFVIIVSEYKLLEPLFIFARSTVIVGFIILLFAILLSFIAAKKITHPILKIHRTIRNIRLDDLGSNMMIKQELNSGVNELDQLHWSFQKMSTRLKDSMDDLLLAQSQELQAKLIALQSQMNPHFLYNTLATIHAMAEENMNEQIIEMSENMSDFLRYISSDESQVNLNTELEHTRKYLEINQIRHGQKLQYSFNIDKQILDLRIPKLIVQPLVENALKFGTKKEPPWNIHIIGSIQNDNWQIEVSDNGFGFSEESLANLDSRIQEVASTSVIPVLKLDGMGLLNIYIRLKLTYGEDMIFRIDNRAPDGATIIIGGSMIK